MKILILDQFSELGGAQRVLLELLPAFQREGWTTLLAAPGGGPLRTHAAELGIACREIVCGPFGCGGKSLVDHIRFGAQLIPMRKQLRLLVQEFDPDLLYVNGPRLVPAACSLGAYAPPIVFHSHSYLKPAYLASATGFFLRRTRATILANCRYVLDPLRGYVQDISAEVIYNGVADCGFRAERRRTGRIGIIGRISLEKGQRVFVEAAAHVHRSFPGSSFVIAGATQFGDLPAEKYFTDIRELARGSPVEFIGWQEDVGEVLRTLDLLVVASLPKSEATTRVIPEAFSAGVPVVASDLPGIREILVDGESGFLFPAGDSVALGNRIREILTMAPERLAGVACTARRTYEERFTLPDFHRRIISSLKRVGASDRA